MIHIIKYTIIENMRNRIYLCALGLLLLIMGVSWMGASINYNFGDFYLSILAFGMSLTEILVVALALFLPVNNLGMEYERGTAPVIWAKLSSRSKYFLGKYLAFLILVFILILASALFIGGLSLLQGASLSQVFLLRYFVFGVFLESACVMSLVFFLYSIFRTSILSSLLGLLIIYFSIFLETAKEISGAASSSFIKVFYMFMYIAMPNLNYFNLENQIVYQKDVSLSYICLIFLYAFIFSGVWISFSHLIVEKKEW